jgi:hypothetical protein
MLHAAPCHRDDVADAVGARQAFERRWSSCRRRACLPSSDRFAIVVARAVSGSGADTLCAAVRVCVLVAVAQALKWQRHTGMLPKGAKYDLFRGQAPSETVEEEQPCGVPHKVIKVCAHLEPCLRAFTTQTSHPAVRREVLPRVRGLLSRRPVAGVG